MGRCSLITPHNSEPNLNMCSFIMKTANKRNAHISKGGEQKDGECNLHFMRKKCPHILQDRQRNTPLCKPKKLFVIILSL